ncbi:MAG: MBL fold metallo-hydrolase [Actinomycetota bacterium]|nr:MBL fold metallo-hydrolase [Actinomycetota bacterium]
MTNLHHLNCASMAAVGSFGGRVSPPRLVAHCLLIEGDDGLTLVDTGLGTADLAAPAKRLTTPFVKMVRPALDPAETAISQIRGLGFEAADVRDVVLTHMDLDHVGGIGDFPKADIHVYADELAAARHPTLSERGRYRKVQWAHGPSWVEHASAGEDWFGFSAVTVLSDDVLMVPLAGHTRGHCGVAVRRPSGGWFLHAGDSYFFHGEKETPPSYSKGLSLFQSAVQRDKKARLENQDRLRTLHADHGDEITVFCAHDETEFDALAGTTD